MVLSAFGADTLRRQRQDQATDKATARVDQGAEGVLDALIRRDAQSDRDRQQDRADAGLELQRTNAEAQRGIAERMAKINEARESRTSFLHDAQVNATVLQGLKDAVKAATNPDAKKIAQMRLDDAEQTQARAVDNAASLKAAADTEESALAQSPGGLGEQADGSFVAGPPSITDKLPEETFNPGAEFFQGSPDERLIEAHRRSGAPASLDLASESGALADQAASFVPSPTNRDTPDPTFNSGVRPTRFLPPVTITGTAPPAEPNLGDAEFFQGQPEERLDTLRRRTIGPGTPAIIPANTVSDPLEVAAAAEEVVIDTPAVRENAVQKAQADAALVAEVAAEDSIGETLARLRQDPKSAERADRLGDDFVRGQIAQLQTARGVAQFEKEQAMLETQVARSKEDRERIKLQLSIKAAAREVEFGNTKEERALFKAMSDDEHWRTSERRMSLKDARRGSGDSKAFKAASKARARSFRDAFKLNTRTDQAATKMEQEAIGPNDVISQAKKAEATNLRNTLKGNKMSEFARLARNAGIFGSDHANAIVDGMLKGKQARSEAEALGMLMRKWQKDEVHNTGGVPPRSAMTSTVEDTDLQVHRQIEADAVVEGHADVAEVAKNMTEWKQGSRYGENSVNLWIRIAREQAVAEGLEPGSAESTQFIADTMNVWWNKRTDLGE